MTLRVTLETLLELEHRGWDALCHSRGGDFYGEVMTENAVMVLVNGAVLSRAEIAASLNASPAWATYAIHEPRMIPCGEHAAILLYRASASREGMDRPFAALMASHYVVAGDRVSLAMYQQTALDARVPTEDADG
ncbi:DUF4440 domain-containing protein [Leucobacter allii]|uniref:DUF4440 domain-containing protein n=1 Tax=Leucobacter allii TaxID=2932247 RepID=UPI001FD2DEA1|nr:DUF4440 domain-containing protein [Leucobacter allii]UOR02900.1 DUF4440 domain-containing protein [Leucobacter allii]